MTNDKVEKQRERLRHFAVKQLGKPYKWGVKKSEIGKYFDCSSLTQYLYRRIDIELPRTSILQAYYGKTLKPAKKPPFFKEKDLRIGDLLFFKAEKGHYTKEFPMGISHPIMYFGEGKFIHCTSPQKVPSNNIGLNQKGMILKGGVTFEKISKIVNRKDLVIAKRILKA